MLGDTIQSQVQLCVVSFFAAATGTQPLEGCCEIATGERTLGLCQELTEHPHYFLGNN